MSNLHATGATPNASDRFCESGACFGVRVNAFGDVEISGGFAPTFSGVAIDTIDSWRVFRDRIKRGELDHIGADLPTAVTS